MNDVFFLSGWAGAPALFPEISRRTRFVIPFLQGDEATLVEAAATSGASLLVGWSTGAHMIVKHAARLIPLFQRVLLIAPFVRFTDSFPARLIRSMLSRMEREPGATSRDFWKACGFSGPAGWQPEWALPLTDGLRYLLVSTAQTAPVASDHVTVLHGTADRIVRPAAVTAVMTALPGAALVRYEGGHCPREAILAPYLDPATPLARPAMSGTNDAFPSRGPGG